MNAHDSYSFEGEPGSTRRPNGKASPPEPPPIDPFVPMDWETLCFRPPPPREFIVMPWLGRGFVTSFYGEGGIGKTLLAQQLASAVALGKPWLGIETKQAPVVMIGCEDDDHEFHRRQIPMCQFMNAGLRELAGKLYLQGRMGLNSTLMAHPRGQPATPLPFLEHLEEHARQVGAGLVVLDNVSLLFAGDEVVRADVTAFITALNGLARRLNCAVLLLGHPPKNAASDYSGSTAWTNTVRARWTLSWAGDAEDGETKDIRVLRRVKANYGPIGEEIRLRRLDDVLRLADEPMSALQRAGMMAEQQAKFLAGLDALIEQRRPTSAASRAGNYAPKLMLKAGVIEGCTARQLEQAMNDLLKDKRLVAGAALWRGKDRKWVTGLARANWQAADE